MLVIDSFCVQLKVDIPAKYKDDTASSQRVHFGRRRLSASAPRREQGKQVPWHNFPFQRCVLDPVFLPQRSFPICQKRFCAYAKGTLHNRTVQ